MLRSTASQHSAASQRASVPQWRWPVPQPRAVREFRAPDHAYGAGHRGLDLVAEPGQPILAPADGLVRFRGRIVDRGVLTIEHAGGYRSSFEPIDSELLAGQSVRAGEPIGRRGTETGHCAGCLHLGVRLGEEYVNPRLLLGGAAPSVLKPWNG